MRSILLSAIVVIGIAGSVTTGTARASALAFDSAADPAYAPYTSFLPNGISGGYGSGSGWEGAGGPNNLDLRGVSAGGFAINSPFTSGGSVWVLPLFSGDPPKSWPSAMRQFDGGLAPGQTFSFDSLKVGDVYLLDANGNTVYEILSGGVTLGHLDGYQILSPLGQFQMAVPYSIPYTDEGEHFSITPIDSNHAVLSATWYGSSGGTASIEVPYSTIDSVVFPYNRKINIGVNNLSITPEPASAALIAAGGLGLLLRRSRKSRR